MKNMDWPRVFSLLAHELRSPAAVIGGYARMLSEGRLAEDDRQQAYAQIERAARRVTVIGQQASDLGHWLKPMPDGASPIALTALVAQSVTLAAAPDRVVTDESIEKSALSIPALDRTALTQALTAAIDAVSREVTDDDVRVAARVNADQHACDILIGPTAALAALPAEASRDGAAVTPMSAEREGLGLALILSTVVVLAHGGQIGTVDGRRDVILLRLRTDSKGDE